MYGVFSEYTVSGSGGGQSTSACYFVMSRDMGQSLHTSPTHCPNVWIKISFPGLDVVGPVLVLVEGPEPFDSHSTVMHLYCKLK